MIPQSICRKIIKNNCEKVFYSNESEIRMAIEQAEIVSFDIFDTLVKRNVAQPEDIFKLVEIAYSKQTGQEISNYVMDRVTAEKKARAKADDEEIAYSEIFEQLSKFSLEERKILRNLEINMEIQFCCPNLMIKKLYSEAMQKRKHVVITSDMYLPESVIKDILEKCNYVGYEKLLLSSSFKKCKSTGRIFEILKQEYSSKNKKIIHIGDNLKSDFIMPRLRGIKSFLIDGSKNKLSFWKDNSKEFRNSIKYRCMYSFLNNNMENRENISRSIGYEVLGPMLLGYCKWLNKNLQENSIEKVFFLSREGRLLQKAYNILFPQAKIKQCYLYVSRQALTVPLLADVNNFNEMVEVMKVFFHNPSLQTLRTMCDINVEFFEKSLNSINLNENTKIHQIPDEKKEKVYSIIKDLGNEKFKRQKAYVIKYLDEMGFDGRVAVCDIGWAGTMQKALEKYSRNENVKIWGYYLGVRDMEEQKCYKNSKRYGYLFEPGKNNEFNLMARFTTGIFETLFLNLQGSVQQYVATNEGILPILLKTEYREKEGKIIQYIHDSALEFLEQWKKNNILENYMCISVELIEKAYSEFAVFPKMSTVKLFENFMFLDGKEIKILPDHKLYYYLLHLKKLRDDLNESHSKIFFLKWLLRVDFPYYRVLRLLAVNFNIKSEYRKRYFSND